MGGDNGFPVSPEVAEKFPFFGGDNGFDFGPQDNTMRTCGLVDFEAFQVNAGIVNNTWFLTVFGTKPTVSMKVELRPRIYIRKPEYWGIEVVGCVPPIVLPTVGPFTESIPVTDFMGTKGIEVIGATKSKTWSLK